MEKKFRIWYALLSLLSLLLNVIPFTTIAAANHNPLVVRDVQVLNQAAGEITPAQPIVAGEKINLALTFLLEEAEVIYQLPANLKFEAQEGQLTPAGTFQVFDGNLHLFFSDNPPAEVQLMLTAKTYASDLLQEEIQFTPEISSWLYYQELEEEPKSIEDDGINKKISAAADSLEQNFDAENSGKNLSAENFNNFYPLRPFANGLQALKNYSLTSADPFQYLTDAEGTYQQHYTQRHLPATADHEDLRNYQYEVIDSINTAAAPQKKIVEDADLFTANYHDYAGVQTKKTVVPTSVPNEFQIQLEMFGDVIQEQAEVDIVLVLDRSGSMLENAGSSRQTRWEQLRQAVDTFTQNLLTGDNQDRIRIGLVGFGSYEDADYYGSIANFSKDQNQVTGFTSDPDKIKEHHLLQVEGIDYFSYTPTFLGLDAAYELIHNPDYGARPGVKKAMVTITDGLPNYGPTNIYGDVEEVGGQISLPLTQDYSSVITDSDYRVDITTTDSEVRYKIPKAGKTKSDLAVIYGRNPQEALLDTKNLALARYQKFQGNILAYSVGAYIADHSADSEAKEFLEAVGSDGAFYGDTTAKLNDVLNTIETSINATLKNGTFVDPMSEYVTYKDFSMDPILLRLAKEGNTFSEVGTIVEGRDSENNLTKYFEDIRENHEAAKLQLENIHLSGIDQADYRYRQGLRIQYTVTLKEAYQDGKFYPTNGATYLHTNHDGTENLADYYLHFAVPSIRSKKYQFDFKLEKEINGPDVGKIVTHQTFKFTLNKVGDSQILARGAVTLDQRGVTQEVVFYHGDRPTEKIVNWGKVFKPDETYELHEENGAFYEAAFSGGNVPGQPNQFKVVYEKAGDIYQGALTMKAENKIFYTPKFEKKIVTASKEPQTFTFTLGTLAGEKVAYGEVKIPANQTTFQEIIFYHNPERTKKITDWTTVLADGETYRLVEEAQPDYQVSYQNREGPGDTFTVAYNTTKEAAGDFGENVLVQVKNERIKNKFNLQIQKKFTGTAELPEGAFEFEIRNQENQGVAFGRTTVTEKNQPTTVEFYQEASYQNKITDWTTILADGESYQLVETESHGAQKIIYSGTGIDDSGRFKVSYDADNQPQEFLVENQKNVFHFNAVKKIIGHGSLPEAGAAFQFELQEQKGPTVAYGKVTVTEKEQAFAIAFYADENFEGAEITDWTDLLIHGKSYQLVEKNHEPYEVTYRIGEKETNLFTAKHDDDEKNRVTVEVTNQNPGGILPSTGGIGRNGFFQLALFLTLTGVLLGLFYRYRIRKKVGEDRMKKIIWRLLLIPILLLLSNLVSPQIFAATTDTVDVVIHKRIYRDIEAGKIIENPNYFENDGSQRSQEDQLLTETIGFNGAEFALYDITAYYKHSGKSAAEIIEYFRKMSAASTVDYLTEQGYQPLLKNIVTSQTADGELGVATIENLSLYHQALAHDAAYLIVETGTTADAQLNIDLRRRTHPLILVMPIRDPVDQSKIITDKIHVYPKNIGYLRDPYFYKFAKKTDGSEESLAGAVFALYREENGERLYLETSPTTNLLNNWRKSEDPLKDSQVDKYISDKNGLVKMGKEKFLPAGTYYFQELETVAGYQISEANQKIKVVIPNSWEDEAGNFQYVTVAGQEMLETHQGEVSEVAQKKQTPRVYNQEVTTPPREEPELPPPSPNLPSTGGKTSGTNKNMRGLLPSTSEIKSSLIVLGLIILLLVGFRWYQIKESEEEEE